MGPLEQAGIPDQKPMEAHGASRGSGSNDDVAPRARRSKSRANGAPSDTIAPEARSGAISRANWPLEQGRVPKPIDDEALLKDPGAP